MRSEPNERTDDELARSVATGGPDANKDFESLAERVWDAVCRCAQRGIQAADVEVVANDVIYKLWRALRDCEFKENEGIRGLLGTLIKNARVDYFRKLGRGRRDCSASDLDPAKTELEVVAQMMIDETNAEVQQVLGGLIVQHRDALRERFLNGKSSAELASAMRIPVEEVYRLVDNAKRAFKRRCPKKLWTDYAECRR